jgi:hypothetical protein
VGFGFRHEGPNLGRIGRLDAMPAGRRQAGIPGRVVADPPPLDRLLDAPEMTAWTWRTVLGARPLRSKRR